MIKTIISLILLFPFSLFSQSTSCFEFDSSTGTITNFLCKNIVSVKIPRTINGVKVLEIGIQAFENKNLISVTIPDTVTNIDGWAFIGNKLTSVTIPPSVKTIGTAAFSSNRITSVTLPNSLTSIDRYAFSTNRITSINLPNSLTTIKEGIFIENRLSSIVIPNSVTSIGREAFAYNKLTSVTLPDSVVSIEQRAFRSNNLKSIILPAHLQSIGAAAFIENQITSVTLPKSLTNLSEGVFDSHVITEQQTNDLASFAALAIDKEDGFYYGWSYDQESEEVAKEVALTECIKRGGNCSIVLSFHGGCGVYRTVSGDVGTAYGWATAPTNAEADTIANNNCLERSNNEECSLYVWACNSDTNAEYKELLNLWTTGIESKVNQLDALMLKYASNVRYDMNTNIGLTKYRESTRIKYENRKILSSNEFNYNTNFPPEPNWVEKLIKGNYSNGVQPETDIRVVKMDLNNDISSKKYVASPTGQDIYYVHGPNPQSNKYFGFKIYGLDNARRAADLLKEILKLY